MFKGCCGYAYASASSVCATSVSCCQPIVPSRIFNSYHSKFQPAGRVTKERMDQHLGHLRRVLRQAQQAPSPESRLDSGLGHPRSGPIYGIFQKMYTLCLEMSKMSRHKLTVDTWIRRLANALWILIDFV